MFQAAREQSAIRTLHNPAIVSSNFISRPTPRLLSFALCLEWINGYVGISQTLSVIAACRRLKVIGAPTPPTNCSRKSPQTVKASVNKEKNEVVRNALY